MVEAGGDIKEARDRTESAEDFCRWSAEDIEAVAHALNTRCRKTLCWKTPRGIQRPATRFKKPMLHPPVEPGQYTSIAFTERLAQAGAAPSVGTVGNAFDNALAESQIGLFKTEVIRRRGPWKGLDDVELATLEWVDWHNHRRLHTACDDLTPTEFEQIYYRQHPAQQEAAVSTQ